MPVISEDDKAENTVNLSVQNQMPRFQYTVLQILATLKICLIAILYGETIAMPSR